jgi:hypothetical protein
MTRSLQARLDTAKDLYSATEEELYYCVGNLRAMPMSAFLEPPVNLQPQGSKAKRYQVKQVRGIRITYLAGENDAD